MKIIAPNFFDRTTFIQCYKYSKTEQKMIFKSVCYLSNNMMRNTSIIVLLLMLSINLEVDLVFANRLNYIYSNQYNISLSREKRQVLFGGKYFIT